MAGSSRDAPSLDHRSHSEPSSSRSLLARSFLAFGSRRGSTQNTSESEVLKQNTFGLDTLVTPPLALADIVFVHGLGGGSVSTWTRSQDPNSYWPERWLGSDPAFENVRIHTFGYDASWGKRKKNPLDVHAYGQALVEELQSHPTVSPANTPILFIGHSMGGLVIKKACIVSKQNPAYRNLASRIHSILFFGTPHRGAALAQTLNKMLRISPVSGSKAFVSNLEAGSELLRELNDQFRHHYAGIHLHSFIESQPMNLGLVNDLVVDPESATLGYAEERSQHLNADHRDLVRFKSPEDSNYRTVRNRLESAIIVIKAEAEKLQQVTSPYPSRDWPSLEGSGALLKQMSMIRDYLKVDHSSEDILTSLDERRLEGSCHWLAQKENFVKWRDSNTQRYYWLQGRPATGKSIMASYVIDHLHGSPCCHHFFKFSEASTTSLSVFLRSMAYQMARINSDVRGAVLSLAEQGTPLDIKDFKNIWRVVILGAVFRPNFRRLHYWIIDALDEAVEATNPETFQYLLQKIDSSIPLKIFITSRPSAEVDQIFSSLQVEVPTDHISSNDSARDIRRFVASQSSSMPVDRADRANFIDMIVDKSAGNFLWAVLVMKQLNQAYTDQDIHDILENVPQEIEALYMRTVRKLHAAKNKSLIQIILTWVICSLRPLSLDEMKDAITWSLGYTVTRDLKRLLATSCGQFVHVDQQSRIRIVHETARAFLTSETLDSDFRIDYPQGHRILAMACLKSMPVAHPRRRSSAVPSGSQKTELMIEDYATLHWSAHVANATPDSDELFKELTEFFGSAVFSWIENLARMRELGRLIHASSHLSNFLDRRRQHAPLAAGELHAWAIDLPRIVTQFGLNLLISPGAIHELVPPFCPRESAIYQRYANTSGGIVLKGLQNMNWSDRVSCIVYKDSFPTALACMDQHFAVGLSDGKVQIYHTSTCEYLSTVEHGESVKILEFGALSKSLASAGLKSIKLWDTASGQLLFSVSTKIEQPQAMAFDDAGQRLITAFRSKSISYWNTSDGELEFQVPWTDLPMEGRGPEIPRTPHGVKISVEQGLMAVIYRGLPIQLWSLERRKPHGACVRPATKHDRHLHHIHAVLLNPNADFPFLAVSYWDDVIFLFDVRTQKVVAQTKASALNMAASPDGRILAGCDSAGGIHLIEFETLHLLHRISVRDDPITAMAFTSDSSRILEIRGIQTNVWEPSVLLSQDSRSAAGSNQKSIDDAQMENKLDILALEQIAAVTALYCCTESGLAFVGRNNGHLDICHLDDPHSSMRELYRHRASSISISRISWSSVSSIIVTVDSSSRFRAMRVQKGPADLRTWSVECLVEDQFGQGSLINQIILDQIGTRLLVSSPGTDVLWRLDKKEKTATVNREKAIWKWYQHPKDAEQLMLFEDDTISTYSWNTLERISSKSTLLGLDDRTTVDVESMLLGAENNLLVFKSTLAQVHQKSSRQEHHLDTKIYTMDLDPITNVKRDKGPCKLPKLCLASRFAVIPDLDIIIGITRIFNTPSLVYISDSGWVCSIVLGADRPESFSRHFFFPSLWLSSNRALIAMVLENQDIAIAHEDSLFVVQDGLHNVQDVDF